MTVLARVCSCTVNIFDYVKKRGTTNALLWAPTDVYEVNSVNSPVPTPTPPNRIYLYTNTISGNGHVLSLASHPVTEYCWLNCVLPSLSLSVNNDANNVYLYAVLF